MSVDDLRGRHYFIIRYHQRPYRVKQTVVGQKKGSILQRTMKNANVISEPKRADSGLLDILSMYTRISGYATIAKGVNSDVGFLPGVKLQAYLEGETGKSLTILKSRKNRDLYVTESLDIKNLKKNLDNYNDSIRYSYAIRNAIFAGLVSTFDELVATLLRTIINQRPEIILSLEKAIPYHQIVSSADFSALQKEIVGTVLSDIMRKPRSEQFAWLEKHVINVSIKDDLPSYYSLVELSERRNAFVHNDGYASEEYYSRVKSTTGTKPENVGSERLHLTPRYFAESTDALIEAYVLISQSVVRKFSKDLSPEELGSIDEHFNRALFDQIQNRRFESASRIAKMMRNKKFKISDVVSKMAVVNAAIAEKKCNREGEAYKLLSDVDWSSVRQEFDICVSAVREDIEKVVRLIPQLKNSEMMPVEAYFEWPAFDWLREKPDFWAALQEVYGDDIQKKVDIIPVSVEVGDVSVDEEASGEVIPDTEKVPPTTAPS